jgi:endonuclease/exonuclease/phosphatase family metal-dependent hydrolase
VPSSSPLRIGTLNLASGRGPSGRPLPAAELAGAVAGLDVDVLAVQEVDAGQPRSAGTDQAAVLAGALGADWRMAAALHGTPGPFRTWRPADPPLLRGAAEPADEPLYGVALLSRRPVRRWSVLGLGGGRGRLPMRATDPRTGRARLWFFPDEPRAAVAAELDGLTVVGTHLSFAPVTAARQLRALAAWAPGGPLVVAGDLNLPGGVPARVLRAEALVRAPSFPAAEPRVQLDHLLGRGVRAGATEVRRLAVGDHRLLLAEVTPDGAP